MQVRGPFLPFKDHELLNSKVPTTNDSNVNTTQEDRRWEKCTASTQSKSPKREVEVLEVGLPCRDLLQTRNQHTLSPWPDP